MWEGERRKAGVPPIKKEDVLSRKARAKGRELR